MAVQPFEAEVQGYDTVHLTWREPTGTWTGFRLVRSRFGFPISAYEGALLIDNPVGYTGLTGGTFTDTNLLGGWNYYSIFLYDPAWGDWVQAGTVSALVPFDYSSTEKMWDLLPEYYKEVHDDTAGTNQQKYRINPVIYLNNEDVVPNLTLAKYLHILGYGFDLLRSQAEAVQDGYDIDTVHTSRMALLAEQFGAAIETSAPANVNRTMIRNLGWLYRKRGTLDGIRELLSMVTGWDVEVTMGPNLMLSEDYADGVNPQPQQWDATVRYVVGDRVRFNNRLYQATAVAYGVSTIPSGTSANNAWWSVDNFVEPLELDVTQRGDTGDVGTWQIQGPTGWISGGTHIGAGAVDPEDGSITYQNAIAFRNDSTAGTVILRSVPRNKNNLAVWNKQLIIESGIPVPKPYKTHSLTTQYQAGDMVMYLGSPYEALASSKGEVPEGSSNWKRLGFDDRVRLALSWYSHGPWSGTVGTGGVRQNAVITEFDENGDFIAETFATPSSFANIFFDPFNVSGVVTSGRVGAKGTWSANGVGTWGQSKDSVSGYAYPPASGRSYQLAPATAADVSVACTVRTIPGAGRLIGVVFRWTDANNFWIATNGGVFKIVGGAARANPASGALTYTLNALDRLRVALSGSTIQVYRNGVLLGTATDSFNSTANRHGIVVEA